MEKKWPTMLKYLPRSVFDWAMRSCNDRKDKIIMASGTCYVDLTVYLAESNKHRLKMKVHCTHGLCTLWDTMAQIWTAALGGTCVHYTCT